MKIQCRTLFDCSRTGVTGHFRSAALPFTDQTGKTIQTQDDWNFSRNQQRNWETIQQMISLRAQPINIEKPTEFEGIWQFAFEVEASGVYSANGSPDDTGALLSECAGIPMIVNLGETASLEPKLVTSGPDQNIWFETINISL